MNDKTTDDEQYWNTVDAFITLANERSEELDLGLVAAAFTHAAARFGAFYAASSSASRKDLKEDKDQLISDFSREFKGRFAENLEDYVENYKIYLPEVDQG